MLVIRISAGTATCLYKLSHTPQTCYTSSLMRAAVMTNSSVNVHQAMHTCAVAANCVLLTASTNWRLKGVSCYFKVDILCSPKPAACKRLHNPACLGKNVQAVIGAVAQSAVCSRECGVQPVLLNAWCEWSRKCRSAVSI